MWRPLVSGGSAGGGRLDEHLDPPVECAAGLVVVRRHGVRFAEALRQKGAHAEVVLNEGCGHEVGNPEVVNRKMISFLNQEWHLDMKY